MQLNINSIKSNLKQFSFKKLFIEDLGWNSFSTNLNPFAFNGTEYSFEPVAELSGMAIILCKSSNGIIPPAQIRKRIDREITKLFFEHILIFVDTNKTKSVWLWMKRGIGKSAKSREHTYYSYQTGDSLISKLSQIAFSFEEFENGKAVLTEVAQRVKKAFDADKVTKKFYDLFKKQREKFFGFIKGIKETEHAEWYTSVMVSRLMFIYFIQKKSFLNSDIDYLSNKLSEIQKHKEDSYYKEFLMPLFFEGFAKKESERKPKINSLLGKIPYLNGGLFLEHQIEQEYKNQIVIPDKAFEELFAFFNQYNWHLDTRDEKDDKEINPDVLGYVFEKYTNQKEMGAYYTKEDITDYICKNTIIPRLFDMLVSNTFAADALIPFPLTEIEPYIYDAVKTKDYLPTETEREYKERQKRYESIKQDFAEGKICRINDLITYNLDIKKFAQDWIYNNDNPEVLSSFYFNCLKKITILDPTVGSGAFLFAALNILEDLYELCLDKFEEFTSNNHPLLNKERDGVRSELSEIQLHNNREYFIYKTIIVNNLYGVDIMEEATEICKLRLFLKLVAQIDDVNKIEPLPDIDFNIKAGNSLVGFASFEEIKKVFDNPLGLKSDIEILSEELAKEISEYKAESLKSGETDQSKKKVINEKLETLKYALNNYLTAVYKVSRKGIDSFIKNYQPFHWWAEFFDIINSGGFDVVIGNPPYVEYSKVKTKYKVHGFSTEVCGNLFVFVMERSYLLLKNRASFGMIVPISLTAAQRMATLQSLLYQIGGTVYLSNYALRPAALFPGIMQRLSICISCKGYPQELFTTEYITWYAEERPVLFNKIFYHNLNNLRLPYSIPKVNNRIAYNCLKKILDCGRHWNSYREMEGKFSLFYHNAGGYWIKTFDYKPFYKSLENSQKNHTTITELRLASKEYSVVYLALLNSSTYYFFWKTITDARHLYPSDIAQFPIKFPFEGALFEKLDKLTHQLMESFKNNSHRIIYGKAEVDQVNVLPSKPIIDEIDKVLAAHYGFTEEELDFIINYDIKYRMGNASAEDTEEEE